MMKKPEQTCLSCKRFHLVDVHQGKCRKDKGKIDKSEYPVMKHADRCDDWIDAGQDYYIRVGWIKRQLDSD